MSGSMITGLAHVASIVSREPRIEFYGVSFPWLAVVLLYQIPVLFFTFLAARRKLESDRMHAFSKPQGIAAMATLGGLLLGGIWSMPDSDWLATAVLYLLVALGGILTVMVTPTQAEYYKGLWRTFKQGRSALSFREDASLNRAFLIGVCGIILFTATMAWHRLVDSTAPRATPIRQAYHLAIANGVLVVAYLGLAHQYFQLRFGRRGSSFLALFLFFTSILPLVLGTITLFSRTMDPGPSQVIYALSPIAGIGLATGIGQGSTDNLMAIEAAAITPSLLYTFVFNQLVGVARRRVRRAVLTGIEKTKQPGGSELAEPA